MDTRVKIRVEERMKKVQKYSLKSESLLQVFKSVDRFSQKIQVNFIKVLYGYVYVSLFFI